MSICINCDKYKNNEHCIDDIGYCEYQLAEHDKKIRADAIEKLKWLVIKNHCDELHCRHCDDKPRSPKKTLCALSDLEEHFDKAIEQLKEQE